jgi:hypothetical protein
MSNLSAKPIVDKNGKATTVHVKNDSGKVDVNARLNSLKTSYVPWTPKLVRPKMDFNPKELTDLGLKGFTATDDEGVKTYIVIDTPRPRKDKDLLDAFAESKQLGARSQDAEGVLVTEVTEDEFNEGREIPNFAKNLKEYRLYSTWVDSLEDVIKYYDSPYFIQG